MKQTYKFQRTYMKANGEVKKGEVIEKDTLWDAEKKFYNTIGVDMENPDIIEEEVIVWSFNENGDVFIPFSKKWVTPVEPTSEPVVTTDDIVAKLIAEGKLSQDDINAAKEALEQPLEG